MPRSSEFEYQGFKKSGSKSEDPNEITKVVAVLKAQKASAASKLADEFIKIQEEKQRIDALELKFKEKGREFVGNLFDADDEIWTRVVQTAKVSMQISKATVRTTVKFDEEGFYNALVKLAPQLTDKLIKLRKSYTVTSSIPVASSFKASLASEGILDFSKKALDYLKNIGTKFLDYIKNWGKSYDDQLVGIENRFKTVMPFESFKNYMVYQDIINECK
jgi:hypothetical protein